MRTTILLSLLAMTAFAGCAENEPVTDPATTDSDGDGFNDAAEQAAGSDPTNATSTPLVRVEESATYTDSGLIIGGVEDVSGGTCGAFVESGTITFTWDLSAPAGSSKASVRDLVFTATYPPTMPEGDIYVFDPQGQQITDATPAAIPPAETDRVEAPGTHPAGVYTIEVRGCAGAGEVAMEAMGTLIYMVPGTMIA